MLLKALLLETRLGFANTCGPEIGGITKAFLGQMIVLYILCLKLAKIEKILITKLQNI